MLTIAAIAIASVLASFTDWVFMDLLVHQSYAEAPALWRPRGGTMRIALSQLIATMPTAVTVGMCVVMPGHPLLVALGAWLAGPLPVIAQNLQWMNLRPAIAASHAIAWLARAVFAAVAYVVLLD